MHAQKHDTKRTEHKKKKYNFIFESYAYWTVHHLDIWMKVDQLCWHLHYYVNLLHNMFRMLIHPSSGACDYLVRYCVGCIVLTWGVLVLCSGIGCWWCGIRVQAEPLLKMDVLTSETCWAVNWHNKASVIKVGLPLFKRLYLLSFPPLFSFAVDFTVCSTKHYMACYLRGLTS